MDERQLRHQREKMRLPWSPLVKMLMYCIIHNMGYFTAGVLLDIITYQGFSVAQLIVHC